VSNSAYINLPSAAIKTASLRYLDEILKVKCGPDLLALGIFPNAKEITESFAAFQVVRRQMMDRLGDENGLCIVIGDGNTPRTGATIAYRSRWNVVSVDPRMKMGDHTTVSKNPAIQRLTRMRMKIENAWDVLRPEIEKASFVVVVAVHSHAPLQPPPWVKPCLVVAIPCCVKQEMGKSPSFSYEDWGIHSPQRKVHVWRREHDLVLDNGMN
jgi:hypothetical protein